MVAVFLGKDMRLFNNTIEYPIQRSECRLARITYDDAFGDRRSVLLKFSNQVESLKIGGTASAGTVTQSGIVTEYDVSCEKIVVLASDGQYYSCVRCPDESLRVGQLIFLVEHMDHHANQFRTFNYLATARSGTFELNSIRVIGRNIDGQDITTAYIDPYTGQVNYGIVDTARI